MNWSWWKVYDLNAFGDVPERYLSVNLDGVGQTDIVIARGFNFCILFLGYWCVPNLNGRNAFTVNDKVGAYIDEDNNLWVGRNEDNK